LHVGCLHHTTGNSELMNKYHSPKNKQLLCSKIRWRNNLHTFGTKQHSTTCMPDSLSVRLSYCRHHSAQTSPLPATTTYTHLDITHVPDKSPCYFSAAAAASAIVCCYVRVSAPAASGAALSTAILSAASRLLQLPLLLPLLLTPHSAAAAPRSEAAAAALKWSPPTSPAALAGVLPLLLVPDPSAQRKVAAEPLTALPVPALRQ
jgi:hypothetical protein